MSVWYQKVFIKSQGKPSNVFACTQFVLMSHINVHVTWRVVKTIWRKRNTIAFIWHKNILRYLSLDVFMNKLEARNFLWALLLENCSLLSTEHVCRQKSKHTFAPGGGYIIYMHPWDQKSVPWQGCQNKPAWNLLLKNLLTTLPEKKCLIMACLKVVRL